MQERLYKMTSIGFFSPFTSSKHTSNGTPHDCYQTRKPVSTKVTQQVLDIHSEMDYVGIQQHYLQTGAVDAHYRLVKQEKNGKKSLGKQIFPFLSFSGR